MNIDMNWKNLTQDTPEGLKKSMTPFYCACAFGHFEVVEFLLKNNQQVYDKEQRWVIDIHVTNDRGCNVIWSVCNGGHVGTLKLLLSSTTVDYELPDVNGITPLEIAEANASCGDGSWRNGNEIVSLLRGMLNSENAQSAPSLQIDRSLLSSHVGPLNSFKSNGSLHLQSTVSRTASRNRNAVLPQSDAVNKKDKIGELSTTDNEALKSTCDSEQASPDIWRLAVDPRYRRCSLEEFETAAKDVVLSKLK